MAGGGGDGKLLEQIMRLASAIVQPSEAELPLLEALCTAAEEEIRRRLREEITPEDCGDAFLCASALLAAAGLLPCRSGGDVEQFTVGDVSVRTGGGGQVCQAAAAMRQQSASLMAPYWGDGAFAFQGLRR